MTRQRHVHRFKRHTYKSGNAVFFCTLPDCAFKVDTKLALGKSCICNRCGNEFRIDEISIRLAKPHCKLCTKAKVNGVQAETHIPEVVNETVDSLRERLVSVVTAEDSERAQHGDEDI